MLSKNPLDIPSSKKLSSSEVAQALRLAIIAELDAINLYLQLASSIEDEKVRKVFEDVALEEKTHVGEFLAMLKNMDPEQVEELEKGAEEVREITGVETAGSAEPVRKGNAKSWSDFEEFVKAQVRNTVKELSLIRNNLPVIMLGKGASSTVFEREPGKQIIIPLNEVSVNFLISRREVDNWLSGVSDLSLPDVFKASRELVLAEDRLVLERLLECKETITYDVGTWESGDEVVNDVARAVSTLMSSGFHKNIMMIINPARYAKLLRVDSRTGLTTLERVKAFVSNIVITPLISEKETIILSSTPEVVDVAVGGNSEVDYIGPKDGLHEFRAWSSIAARIKNGHGIVILREK
ncbi:encapsulin [Thermosphaera chiliense]|uniref:Encapsulin n=1 Tax=Thermosphaera chiliense TaxID=3402707 RepID=A0A7M1UUZ6_9CREN|nr:family 1 encapsulin nanocompartment shell protein [Thermosphaera aggregans]QOR94974.1 encapsulin [Thermosphaera aggregans]